MNVKSLSFILVTSIFEENVFFFRDMFFWCHLISIGDFKSFYNFKVTHTKISMLDTSYGFNNLLKEVRLFSPRDTNTTPASKKSSSRISMPARKSAEKSKDLSDPSVLTTHPQKNVPLHCPLWLLPGVPVGSGHLLPFLNIFKLCRSQEDGGEPYR